MKLDRETLEDIEKAADAMDALANDNGDEPGPKVSEDEISFWVYEGLQRIIDRLELFGNQNWANKIQGSYDAFSRDLSEYSNSTRDNNRAKDRILLNMLDLGVQGRVQRLANLLRVTAHVAKSNTASAGADSSPPNKSRGKGKQPNTKINELLLINAALLEHHNFGKVDINFEPATQEKLGKMLRWPQYKVSKAIQRCFPEGWWRQQYIPSCKTESITGFLTNLDDGHVSVDAVSNRPHHPTDPE